MLYVRRLVLNEAETQDLRLKLSGFVTSQMFALHNRDSMKGPIYGSDTK